MIYFPIEYMGNFFYPQVLMRKKIYQRVENDEKSLRDLTTYDPGCGVTIAISESAER